MEIKIPAALVAEYDQPRPVAAGVVSDRITGLVAELDSPNWRHRGTAQSKLLTMGPIAIRTLRQLYPNLSVETQQRIDLVMPLLEAQGKRAVGSP